MQSQQTSTLSYSKQLKSCGMDERLADLIAEREYFTIKNELATKSDIENLRIKLEKLISDMELRTYKIMFSMFVGFGLLQHFFK